MIGYHNGNFSELISEVVFRSGRFAEVDSSSIFFAEQVRFACH